MNNIDNRFVIKGYQYIESNKTAKNIIIIGNKIITNAYLIVYFLVLIYIFFLDKEKMLLYITLPSINMLILLGLRKGINKKRPFEQLDFIPHIKHKRGKSFPSNHAGASMIISLMAFTINTIVGCALLFLSFTLGIFRVMLGVHYPSDIIWSYIIAISILIIFWQFI